MKKSRSAAGRPKKYADIIVALDDEKLYTPAAIADLALELGFSDRNPNVDQKLFRLRIRIAMSRLCSNWDFPKHGDGMIQRKGQPTTPAWSGSRWKATIDESRDALIKRRP